MRRRSEAACSSASHEYRPAFCIYEENPWSSGLPASGVWPVSPPCVALSVLVRVGAAV